MKASPAPCAGLARRVGAGDPGPVRGDGERRERAARRLGQAGHHDDAGAAPPHRVGRRQGLVLGGDGEARQVLQLDRVGRDDVGRRHERLAEARRQRAVHVERLARVADHRIAAVERRGPRGLHPGDGLGDDLRRLRIAQVARQHRLAPPQDAPLLEPVEQRPQLDRRRHAPASAPVTRMIAQVHRVERPDLEAQPLQQKHRRAVPHVAVHDPGLDGQDAHAGKHSRLPETSRLLASGLHD